MKALVRFLELPELQRASLLRRKLPASFTHRGHRRGRMPMHSAATGKSGQVAVTCVAHPTTGVGHRFAEWNTGLIVARSSGCQYVSAGLGGGWDEAFGLSRHFEDAAHYIKRARPKRIRLPYVGWHDRPQALVELSRLVREIASCEKNALVFLSDGQNLFRHDDSAAELRMMYWANRTTARALEPIKIAVHIRRGDVAQMRAQAAPGWEARYVELNWFAGVLQAINSGLAGRALEISVYSQGAEGDFELLRAGLAVRFRLNGDPIEAFHEMVQSDILIVSPSSFSFNAGLVCRGMKIARWPWWHEIPESDDWVRVDAKTASFEFITKRVSSHFALRQGTYMSNTTC
jgi:hypothetical protein